MDGSDHTDTSPNSYGDVATLLLEHGTRVVPSDILFVKNADVIQALLQHLTLYQLEIDTLVGNYIVGNYIVGNRKLPDYVFLQLVSDDFQLDLSGE